MAVQDRDECGAGHRPPAFPARTPHDLRPPGPGRLAWVDPYPDQAFPCAPEFASPEARYEQRESLELAFVAALQYLSPLQRAALILQEVLGFSNKETAELLSTTVPAVQSALQRARAAVRDRVPGRSQQATLRAAGDERLRALVQDYCDAIERADVDAVVGMLTADAAYAMPPVLTWYQGRQAIAGFLAGWGFRETWRRLPARASGQLAAGGYTFDSRRGRWVASALDVLTLAPDGTQIAQVTCFVTAELLARWGYDDDRFTGAAVFPRFGLPPELPA
ncbi:MAG TPA: sigma factor-like helix-turn-helix DNA-binding protein [Streptosporangiaceae bacterium]